MLLLICLAFVGLCAGQGNNQYAKIFEQDVDTNNDTIAELSEFQAIFDKYDLNKDGQVPKAEYIQATGDTGRGASIFFDFNDPNKDGVVHRSEVPGVIRFYDINEYILHSAIFQLYGDGLHIMELGPDNPVINSMTIDAMATSPRQSLPHTIVK